MTNCDGVEIVVSMSDEISGAITSWASVAELYERKTEMTLEVLGQFFLTRNQFIAFDVEIKFYISRGLGEKDREILEESSLYVNERFKSPEKKLLAESRNHIKKKITKIYNRLLQELFPSFLPAKSEIFPRVKVEKEREDDDTIPYPNNDVDDNETTTTEGNVFDEIESVLNISAMSLQEPTEHIAPQITRPMYANATRTKPQDLFETPENALRLIEPILSTLKDKILYEPCCGNGAIVRFLEARGFTVVARDLYTTQVKQDYLVEDDPEYDVLITNPREYNFVLYLLRIISD